ncbi:MAG: prepilin-type N-terminal cleavage/methylation domain-containing protein [Candidatus Vogelbacteria bacterium]|nr:prepilin-type N-terminal cleavage/methylation domain-containing protein [Candidatus Vogelbacteria bacterium]
MMKNVLKKSGFTLIELLVVIAIIGILSSVVLVSLTSARAKARDAKRIADIEAIKSALALYYDSNSVYPNTVGDLTTAGLLSATPADPSGGSYLYAVANGSTDGSLSYHLGATLEQVSEGSGVLATDKDCKSSAATFCPGFTAAPTAAGSDPDGGFDGSSGTAKVYDVTP